jgi:hypothetical protein
MRAAEAQRRKATAAMQSMSVGPVSAPPFALANDPATLHQEMLKRIAALEDTIAKLPPAPYEKEIEEIEKDIAQLKAQPPVPTQRPIDAVKSESRVRALGEKVLVGVATSLATTAVSAASNALWARFGDQLKALADAISAWIASL